MQASQSATGDSSRSIRFSTSKRGLLSRPGTAGILRSRQHDTGQALLLTTGRVSEAERAAFFAETPRSAEIAALWAPPPAKKRAASGANGGSSICSSQNSGGWLPNSRPATIRAWQQRKQPGDTGRNLLGPRPATSATVDKAKQNQLRPSTADGPAALAQAALLQQQQGGHRPPLCEGLFFGDTGTLSGIPAAWGAGTSSDVGASASEQLPFWLQPADVGSATARSVDPDSGPAALPHAAARSLFPPYSALQENAPQQQPGMRVYSCRRRVVTPLAGAIPHRSAVGFSAKQRHSVLAAGRRDKQGDVVAAAGSPQQFQQAFFQQHQLTGVPPLPAQQLKTYEDGGC